MFARLILIDQFAQPGHAGALKRIDNAAPLASASHNAGSVEDLHVPGDVWLIFIECVYHLANRHCSSHQYLENPETLGLSQSAKSRGNAIQHFITHSQLARTVILDHL